ncbi:putative 3-Beta-hydroxysteroid-delta(8), delta(7)-isomerase [Trypanosoma conorhini]|uniref:Putative 3-Beta-hydroxysteroid-delta(8), delta(7)-isomerase n=1 Tax=Trypanosoma conorhini TaxID=83891 RepID=A0A422P324_9TRYP|nr:putative 3-Beta-hydroxysteroid-delta(8), delta(7)-isomerase [Trypanosoma conorhini]RNF12065.1 putative 3-Beta-hydroxysteroid-delta(8), delta(7)-isomerase [Trypanosoma conorhini]
MFLEVFVDPFVCFCVGCIAAPLIVDRERLAYADVVGYLTEPAMLFAAALLLLVVAEARVARWRRGSPPLSTFSERLRARWYLLNGVVIHILMDGLVGVFKASTLLASSYAKIDKRYGARLGSFEGSAVHVVSLLELCVKGPLCILLYRAYQTRSPHRDALEFFSCVTQAYGTVVYLGQELISGMPHLDVDRDLEFTPHYLVYFWFAVAFGCVLYLIVPCWWGWEAYTRLVAASARAARSASPHTQPKKTK